MHEADGFSVSTAIWTKVAVISARSQHIRTAPRPVFTALATLPSGRHRRLCRTWLSRWIDSKELCGIARDILNQTPEHWGFPAPALFVG